MTDRAALVIMISGRGSNMAALIEACTSVDYPAKVIGVISDRAQAPGLETAKAAGIPTAAIVRKDFGSKPEHEAAILAQLHKFNPDLICLAGFMRILSGDFVRQFEDKILNIHPSLLPKYTGLNTHARAMEAGDKTHGCTVHFVTEGLDEGPIVAQSVVDIVPGETVETLEQKVLKVEHALYVSAVAKVLGKSD